MFTTARYLSLSYAGRNNSRYSQPKTLKSVLILFSIFAWVCQAVSFPQVFSKYCICFPSVPIRSTCSAHLVPLDLFILMIYIANTLRTSPVVISCHSFMKVLKAGYIYLHRKGDSLDEIVLQAIMCI